MEINEAPLVVFEALPAEAEVEAARARLERAWGGCGDQREGRPFLVITPAGMAQWPLIAAWLAQRGVRYGPARPLSDWAALSTALYCRTLTAERLQVALIFEELWRRAEPTMAAELWTLAEPADLALVAGLKDELRALLGTRRYRVELPGLTIPTPGQVVRLQPLHAPDLARYGWEWCVLAQLGAI